MAEMGKYCKAYLASDFKKYPSWDPKLENLRPADADDPSQEPEKREQLDDDDILYLQENFVVTDGIFKDEHVVYDQVDDDWKRFCEQELEFAIPEDVAAIGAEQEAERAAGDDDAGAGAAG